MLRSSKHLLLVSAVLSSSALGGCADPQYGIAQMHAEASLYASHGLTQNMAMWEDGYQP